MADNDVARRKLLCACEPGDPCGLLQLQEVATGDGEDGFRATGAAREELMLGLCQRGNGPEAAPCPGKGHATEDTDTDLCRLVCDSDDCPSIDGELKNILVRVYSMTLNTLEYYCRNPFDVHRKLDKFERVQAELRRAMLLALDIPPSDSAGWAGRTLEPVGWSTISADEDTDIPAREFISEAGEAIEIEASVEKIIVSGIAQIHTRVGAETDKGNRIPKDMRVYLQILDCLATAIEHLRDASVPVRTW